MVSQSVSRRCRSLWAWASTSNLCPDHVDVSSPILTNSLALDYRTIASRTIASRTIPSRTIASRTIPSRTTPSLTIASIVLHKLIERNIY